MPVREEWRDLPGYDGFYQISTLGRIRTFRDQHRKGCRLKEPKILTPTHSKTGYAYYIVIKWQGHQRTVQVGRAMAETFIGKIPKGMIAYHKDGDSRNNALWNIGIGDRAELARERMREKVAGWNRSPVVKIDRTLTVVDAYPSITKVTYANGFTQQMMWRYCSMKIDLSVFAPDDFIYTFDNTRWVWMAIKRAMAELDAMGVRYNNPFTGRYFDLPANDDPEIDLASLQWSQVPALAGDDFRENVG